MEQRTSTTETKRRGSGSVRSVEKDEREETLRSTCGACVDSVTYSDAHVCNACTEIGNVHDVGDHEKQCSDKPLDNNKRRLNWSYGE